METFSASLVLCEGNPPVTGGFPSQRPVTRSFDFFFDLCLNKRLSHETMVCSVCLSILLWIFDMVGLLGGPFVSWWYVPWIWPPVTDMQHYNCARYPTDDWHLSYMFSMVYYSVEVCLEGVFLHYVTTRRDPCVRVHAPLTLAFPPHEKTKSNRSPCHFLVPNKHQALIWTSAWLL